MKRPHWQLLLQETSFLFRLVLTAGCVHPVIFHLPLLDCLRNVSDRCSWLSKKTPQPFLLAKFWLHPSLVVPQSEQHILVAFILTRGCGHPKLMSDLQEQGTVHQKETVTEKRLRHRHQTFQDIVYRLRESTVMFSSSLFLQENVLFRTDIQMTTEYQMVLGTLRQQMDFMSGTLLLMR